MTELGEIATIEESARAAYVRAAHVLREAVAVRQGAVRREHDAEVLMCAAAAALIQVSRDADAVCGTVITSSEPIALTPKIVNSATVGKGLLVE